MTISGSIELYDNFSGVIGNISRAMNLMISSISDMQASMESGVSTASLDGARAALQEMGAAAAAFEERMDQVKNSIANSEDAQNRLNKAVADGTGKYNELMDKIKGCIGVYAGFKTVSSIIDTADELAQTNARLDMMVENFGEVASGEELFRKVYNSAQNARGSISETADIVARFGNNAKDAFSSTDEVIEFANLVQKQMVIAGAGTQEASNAMLQLSQALGSGVLRGDELNSIFEQAPNLIQTIAEYLKVPIGSIREMATEGKLTADIVKAAMFDRAGEIEEKFNNMPLTWNQSFQQMKNAAIIAFQPVLTRLSQLTSTEAFKSFGDNATATLGFVAEVALNIFNTVAAIGGFLYDNWAVIEPVIMGVVTALGLYCTAMMTYTAVTKAGAAITAIQALASQRQAAALAMQEGATFAATVKQYGFNAALLACPITWIILGIVALIAVIFAIVGAINKAEGTTVSAIGVVCSMVAMAGAFIWNAVIGVINGIIQYAWSSFAEPFIGIIEWILNACNGGFDSFGDAVQNLLGQIIGWFLSLGEVVTKIIDAIFGTDWTSGLESLKNELINEGKNEKAITLERKAPELPVQRIEYSDAALAGYEFGENISNKIGGFTTDITENIIPDSFNVGSFAGNNGVVDEMADNVNKIANNTEEIKNNKDIQDLIRDYHSTQATKGNTTQFITIDMSGHTNNIANTMDVAEVEDSIINGIVEALGGSPELA